MKTITDLEIYSAYLPYGLKGQLQWDKKEDFIHEEWAEDLNIFEKGSKWTLCGYANKDLNIPLGDGEFSGWLWRNDMTYVCFHNNEIKLILKPLSDLENDKEFNSKYFISNDRTEGFKIKRKNETYTRLNELNYLFKNHFDVFGLIEKGKAININTL